jgi:signal transduction histidine kinase
MPRFSAHGALKVYKDSLVDIPFIIVSGTIGEDIAVEAMRRGARDFLVKGKLARLVPAVERELHETAIRRERDKMHEQLMISDRMASVGVLAAGVAHEVNNPLSAVIGYLELAIDRAKDLESDDAALGDLIEDMTAAHESATRIRDIVRDLKLFSRSGEDKRTAVDVEQVLDSTLRMASNEIRHRARLVKSYGSVPPVDANESRLGQVFLNLIVNAAQSMKEGQADSNELRVTTNVASDGRVVVEIADTGAGMPPDVQKRLFTPFFTTKPVGVGTGLGLSICHRIVTGLGGVITVSSNVGEGSVFRVVLPVAQSPVEPRRHHESIAAPAVRRGRILVVDDGEGARGARGGRHDPRRRRARGDLPG